MVTLLFGGARRRSAPMKCTSEDEIVVGAQLVESFRESAVVYETAGLVDDDERQHTPEKLSLSTLFKEPQSNSGRDVNFCNPLAASHRIVTFCDSRIPTPVFRRQLPPTATPKHSLPTSRRSDLCASDISFATTATPVSLPICLTNPSLSSGHCISPNMSGQSNGARGANNQFTSRAKPTPPGNEEASAVLNLGEFQDVDTLTLSEASLVINALVSLDPPDTRATAATAPEEGGRLWWTSTCKRHMIADAGRNRMLTKTMDYLDNFARFQKKENVEAVERLLSAHKEFHKFERAQLGTLCCADADEAKTLIPSLQDKITDEDLGELLEEMQKFR
ncbi:hypothetical protein TruAng_005097 [Truncatella angustata]|nr:hypothetical protein TruAng_005097 [Truncatella angustata]